MVTSLMSSSAVRVMSNCVEDPSEKTKIVVSGARIPSERESAARKRKYAKIPSESTRRRQASRTRLPQDPGRDQPENEGGSGIKGPGDQGVWTAAPFDQKALKMRLNLMTTLT